MSSPLHKALYNCLARVLGGLGAGVAVHQYLSRDPNGLWATIPASLLCFCLMVYFEYKKEGI